ncbi:MAG TPA: hypothetical protein PLF88_10240 [Opitutaceae bacterium]|nr:hypothetical protein [Opitutaceae bacterium]HRJ45792.1 hypothetical protein [Opitutaceae bacterium]
MKFLRPVLYLVFASVAAAQSRDDEIPVFDLDDYLITPKMTLGVGFRGLTGPKVDFKSGAGVVNSIRSTQDHGDLTSTGIIRNYHDGFVALDRRLDADENPVNDGQTNTWRFVDERQLTADGYVTMSTYRADVFDGASRERDGGNSFGAELMVSRDMGKLGGRMEWRLFAGLSINDVNVSTRDSLLAEVTRLTDFYFLNGAEFPFVPYTAPSVTTDAEGNIVNTTVLLGQAPNSRVTTVTNNVEVNSFWKLKGSFLTVRLGPTVSYMVKDNIRLSLSAGPAFAYVGTNYTVEQSFLPDTSDAITTATTEMDDDFLTGYFVDATVEYLLTERAGLYMGAFYQSTGTYEQSLAATGVNYTARLDMRSMQGLRAGLNYRF